MKTCLIMDDDSVRRKQSRRIVEGLGFHVVEAADAPAGLDICQLRMPNAILVDAEMKGMSGIDFLETLVKLPDGDGPRILYCTSEHSVPELARAFRAGAHEYLLKPFDKAIVTDKFQEVGLI